jgi:hypothetical protein
MALKTVAEMTQDQVMTALMETNARLNVLSDYQEKLQESLRAEWAKTRAAETVHTHGKVRAPLAKYPLIQVDKEAMLAEMEKIKKE